MFAMKEIKSQPNLRYNHPTLARKCTTKNCPLEPEQSFLQRRAHLPAPTINEAPPIVHEVLRSPGQPLDESTRTFMEPRFNQDFSHVRVHTNAKAAESARAVNALAYTVGRDIVMQQQEYTPATAAGKRLLAHELVHVVQQDGNNRLQKLQVGAVGDVYEREADQVAKRVMGMTPEVGKKVQQNSLYPSPVFGNLETRWHASKSGSSPLSEPVRALMEPRFNADFSEVRVPTDEAIMPMSRELGAQAFTYGHNIHFGAGQSSNNNELMAHKLTHVIQQRFKLTSQIQRQVQPNCNVEQPEHCPTYETWISTFNKLPTFTSDEGVAAEGQQFGKFQVLGDSAASRDPDAPTDQQAPTPTAEQLGDRFIDHPSDKWVQDNLPSNLHAIAYQLPADCADMLVILRHIYLSAHHRTEKYNGWLVGDRRGRSAVWRIHKVIRSVYSGNAHKTINPYSDSRGTHIRDFNRLQKLLHPGDQLVWQHHNNGLDKPRTGGHGQTVMDIERSGSTISKIKVLQGNQPISQKSAQEIIDKLNEERKLANKSPLPTKQTREGGPLEKKLRNTPGRRIEVSTLSGTDLHDIDLPTTPPKKVWGWSNNSTILVVAGPARARARPSMRKNNKGKPRERRISDWFGVLKSASKNRLHGSLEAALYETRALLDSEQSVENSTASKLGSIAGQRLWKLAKRQVTRTVRSKSLPQSNDLGQQIHFDMLYRMRAMIRALGGIEPKNYQGNPNAAKQVRTTLTQVDTAFNFAARGGDDIYFKRHHRPSSTLLKVLLTGFDPFGRQALTSRKWNPSATAVLNMDGKTISIGSGNKIAVEGVVLPVSFQQFHNGIVEQMIDQAGQDIDAVITVSLDPNLNSTDLARLEQFAIGVHKVFDLQPHRLFAEEKITPKGLTAISDQGSPIIETNANLQDIATHTNKSGSKGLFQVEIGNDITLDFGNLDEANKAKTVLGLDQPIIDNSKLKISDEQVLHTIISSMQWHDQTQAKIKFTVAVENQNFIAQIIEGLFQVEIGNDITLDFGNLDEANKAKTVLGLDQPIIDNSKLKISDEQVLHTIISSMQWHDQTQAKIKFTVAVENQNFIAQIIEGPGGNFLSNEVSYRTQQKLSQHKNSALSFHIHTPGGAILPKNARGFKNQQALLKARKTVAKLIETLKRIIRVVGQEKIENNAKNISK